MDCVVYRLMDHGGSTCLGKESVTPGSPNTLRTTAGVDCVRLLAPWRGNERHSFRGVRLCICLARVAEQRRGSCSYPHSALGGRLHEVRPQALRSGFVKYVIMSLGRAPAVLCRAGTCLPRVRGHRPVHRHKRWPHRGRWPWRDGRQRWPGRARLRGCAE